MKLKQITASLVAATMFASNPVFAQAGAKVSGEVVKIGRTSIQVWAEAWATRATGGERHKVTEGKFTYVAIDENRKPRPLPGKA